MEDNGFKDNWYVLWLRWRRQNTLGKIQKQFDNSSTTELNIVISQRCTLMFVANARTLDRFLMCQY
jgi:hypothetical protein